MVSELGKALNTSSSNTMSMLSSSLNGLFALLEFLCLDRLCSSASFMFKKSSQISLCARYLPLWNDDNDDDDEEELEEEGEDIWHGPVCTEGHSLESIGRERANLLA